MTAPYWGAEGITLYLGDCLDVLRAMPAASMDAVVTDPPAGIGFMGRDWDGDLGGRGPWVAWHAERLAEAARVLKPGGHALVWALPRTSHWTACAVEDAGLTIRDCITHLFGSGFPKGANALKPAAEHWWLARKPLAGTVAATVQAHGTGALNIDATRVAAGQDYRDKCASVVGIDTSRNGDAYGEWPGARTDSAHQAGRWPTNVILSHPPLMVDGEVVGDACAAGCVDGCPVRDLDRQSGTLASGGARHNRHPDRDRAAYGTFGGQAECAPHAPPDSGGASRFFPVFRYEAKAPTSERPKLPDGTAHTTVKPLALMRWLVRLVTPPGGTVLDPFAGSGTTGEAALVEGFRAVLIEREEPHAELIKARLGKPISPVLDFEGEIA